MNKNIVAILVMIFLVAGEGVGGVGKTVPWLLRWWELINVYAALDRPRSRRSPRKAMTGNKHRFLEEALVS